MSKDTLDLDAIIPSKKTVTINGKKLVCNPPTVEDILYLQKAELKLQGIDSVEGKVNLVHDIVSRMEGLVPGISDHRITIEQFNSLVSFIFSSAAPDGDPPPKAEEDEEPQ